MIATNYSSHRQQIVLGMIVTLAAALIKTNGVAAQVPSSFPSTNPSSSPSSSPSSGGLVCADSPLPVTGYSGAGCVEVGADAATYCAFAGASSHCPDTCDRCSKYQCQDSELPWDLFGMSYTCTDLAGLNQTDTAFYCDTIPELQDTCRFTCETCKQGELTNVALNMPTTQSSTSSGGVSSRGVDGNRDGQWSGGSITHTANEAGPFWNVFFDLQYHLIEEVRVYNRVDCCSNRLDGFIVDIYNEGELVFSYTNPPGTPPYENIIPVGGVIGTSLDVRLPDTTTNPLSLAEVEVYAYV